MKPFGGSGGGDPGWVPGEAALRLEEDADPETVFDRLDLESLAAPLTNGYELVRSTNGQSGVAWLDWLEQDPDVTHASPNARLSSPEADRRSLAFNDGTGTAQTYQGQLSLESMNLDEAHAISTGAGVVIAVLDTGIDASHAEFQNTTILPGFDFVDMDPIPDDERNGVSDDGDGLIDEAWGHGTHVAGLLRLAAPDAAILPLRVLDDEGWGTSFGVAAALFRAVAQGARVVNLSLGVDSADSVLVSTIAHVQAMGVVVLASAGNRDDSEPQYPAASSGVLSVTAVDDTDVKAPFASYGNTVDLSAPGVEVLSTYPEDAYAYWSGSSMAVPSATAAVALLMSLVQDDGIVVDLVTTHAFGIDHLNPDYVGLLGNGRVDFLAPLLALQP